MQVCPVKLKINSGLETQHLENFYFKTEFEGKSERSISHADFYYQ